MTTLPPWLPIAAFVVAACLACFPAVCWRTFRLAQRLRRLSPRSRAIASSAVFVVAAAYLSFTALRQGRPLYPKYHDAQSYALQAQIIATGRLWLPPHPQADFFDTFHVLVEPVYCSMYFPGTAIVFALGVLAGVPLWVVAVVVSAGAVALLFRIVAELLDGWAAALAAVWLVSLPWFRYVSVMVFSQPVMLLLALAMFWAYLQWQRTRAVGWSLLIGLFAGLGAITRPVDALAYAVPVGVAIVYDSLRARARGTRELLLSSAAIVIGAAPWLALQVVFNLGVSGKPFETPYRVYLDRDAPQFSFGFHTFDPTRRPQTPIRQKQDYHNAYNVPMIKAHRPGALLRTWTEWPDGRLPQIAQATAPAWPLLLLLPLGLAGLRDRERSPRRWALAAALAVFCGLYVFYAALLQHYTPVIAPPVILLALLGMRVAERLALGWRDGVVTFFAVLTLVLCASSLPELNRQVRDDPFPYPEMADAHEVHPKQATAPALIFVRYHPGGNVHAEPVYNWSAARIDDNPIVRAHDLGDRNVELLRHYAQHQPRRHVYYYDRDTRSLTPRGTVADELKRLTQAATP